MSSVFKPVGPGRDFHRNAVVEQHDDHVIAMGFAAMAEIAVEHWKTKGPNDLLFIPIVYNHRHALELILKAAIRETAVCLRSDEDSDPKLRQPALDEWISDRKGGHRLLSLAQRLDELLARLQLDKLPTETHAVLVSLHDLDPSGETFRYAKVRENGTFVPAPRPGLTKTKATPKPKLQAHVDVVEMHEHFKGVFDLLSFGLMTELEQVRDFQREMAQQAGF